MKQLRLLLLPFSLIYWVVTTIRNLLYDIGFIKSYPIPGKSIVVGNLSIGGTGKSPLVDYIVNLAIDNQIQVATLSRGYGRKTKGLLTVDIDSCSADVGDEPLLYKLRHQQELKAVVSEDRRLGVEYIQDQFPNNQLIVLDDAYQHRKVQAGLSIIVSDYANPFYTDLLLPAGNLRESRNGIQRTDLLLISKCPPDISKEEMDKIRKRSKLHSENIFFSIIEYGELVPINTIREEIKPEVLLVTGIANPNPLLEYLNKKYNVHHIRYKDHYEFRDSDIHEIHKKINTFAGRCNAVITTEKDFMRLRNLDGIKSDEFMWLYQPIKVKIINPKLFNSRILEYVNEI